MAKRRTLKRQRDEALAELWRMQNRHAIDTAFLMQQYNTRARTVKCQFEVSKDELEEANTTPNIRNFLHKMVDVGLLDMFVKRSCETDCYWLNGKVKLNIELLLLTPDA